MIYIDAREGLSGDMVLAAMIRLLEPDGADSVVNAVSRASRKLGIEFSAAEVDEEGVKGLGISYTAGRRETSSVSWEEAHQSLKEIEQSMGSGSKMGLRILDMIFEDEGKAHGLRPQEVHLHEIGRPQALINIAGIGLVRDNLRSAGSGDFVCSTITTGRGIVVVSHGVVRIPAPASEHLLSGLEHAPGDSPGERATPTGIAAVKALIVSQTDWMPERWSKRGTGFGTKRFGGRLGRTTMYWA
jgi:uncharacterized protein (DUF111 family)